MQNLKKLAHEHSLKKQKSDEISEFTCRVRHLDENETPLEIKVNRESDGQWLLDEVCERLGGIQEKDYFGLRYTDRDKQQQWMDLGKNIYSQMKDIHPMVANFRIKHYPALPLLDLKQELAWHFLYLQLKRDLFSARLLGKSSDLYQLAAFAAQKELGDFDNQNEDTRYVSEMKLLPNLNSKTEGKVMEIHKSLSGLSQDDAEIQFLEKACLLDTYGVEPFFVKDQKGNNLYVGLTHEGVSTFQGSRRAHLFKWLDIAKIHYQGKLFIIQVFLDETFNSQQIKRKHVLGFKCETTFSSAALWMWANDRMCFFSLNRSSEAKRVKSGGGIFKKRKTFRFAGRCQREILQMSSSMVQINDHGLGRSGTLAKDETIKDDGYSQERSKYNTMPPRDRDVFLGTQDSLDSFFNPNHRGSIPNSHQISSSQAHDQETKSHHIMTQSLEHITEESNIAPFEDMKCYSDGSLALDRATFDECRRSSRGLLAVHPDIATKRKVSASNGDIVGALEQLHLAVSESVNHEINEVIKRAKVGRYLTKCVCLCSLLSFFFLLLISFALLFMVLALHYRNDAGSYDYSGFLYDVVSNPNRIAGFVRTQPFPEMGRSVQLWKYLRFFYREQ